MIKKKEKKSFAISLCLQLYVRSCEFWYRGTAGDAYQLLLIRKLPISTSSL
jgi:hypothetical protein